MASNIFLGKIHSKLITQINNRWSKYQRLIDIDTDDENIERKMYMAVSFMAVNTIVILQAQIWEENRALYC